MHPHLTNLSARFDFRSFMNTAPGVQDLFCHDHDHHPHHTEFTTHLLMLAESSCVHCLFCHDHKIISHLPDHLSIPKICGFPNKVSTVKQYAAQTS